LVESSAVTAQGQAVISHSESEQFDVPASVSSVVIASLAMPIVSSVTGSLASSPASVGVLSSSTPVGVTSMLSVRESRPVAELEQMHTDLGALPYAAEFVERVDTSFVQKEKTSSGGTASSDDDVELTVPADNASSDDDDTIELSPQVTVRGLVAGHTEPSAIATSS